MNDLLAMGIQALQEGKKNKETDKNRRRRFLKNDLVYGQIINT